MSYSQNSGPHWLIKTIMSLSLIFGLGLFARAMHIEERHNASVLSTARQEAGAYKNKAARLEAELASVRLRCKAEAR